MMTNLAKAQAAWPEPLPVWIQVLAEACDDRSQKAVADQVQYSPGVISTVLSNCYRGDVNAIQKAVEGALMNVTVQCPVAGEIGMQQCQAFQRRPFKATNSQRVMLFRACRSGCPHSRHTPGGEQ